MEALSEYKVEKFLEILGDISESLACIVESLDEFLYVEEGEEEKAAE